MKNWITFWNSRKMSNVFGQKKHSYIQVLDDKNVRRRFRASNYQSTTRVKLGLESISIDYTVPLLKTLYDIIYIWTRN